MIANVGTTDRVVRGGLGVALQMLALLQPIALFESGSVSTIALIVGIVLLATSALSFCPLYRLLGIGTRS